VKWKTISKTFPMTLAMKKRTNFLILTLVPALYAEAPRLPAGTAGTVFPTVGSTPSAAVTAGSDAALIAKITPAVVSVFPATIVNAGETPDVLARYFGKDKDKANQEEPESAAEREAPDNQKVQGVGSGVILTSDGWIVTNNHVVQFHTGKLADAVSVELSDHRFFDAIIVGVDLQTDLALLKIATTGLPFVPLGDSDSLSVGDPVFAVGNPFKVGITATKGMVSALRRANLGINGPNSYESFIQTDASINPGNSGGALINAQGQLIGINSAIWTNGARAGNIGIGFAIPSNLTRSVISQLAETGKVVRGFFGLQLDEVGRKDATTAGLSALAGAKVTTIKEEGPAAMAGLLAGDIILTANSKPIETKGDLRLIFGMSKPGDAITVAYHRGPKEMTATITAASSETSATTTTKAGKAFAVASLPNLEFTLGEEGLLLMKVPPDIAKLTGLTQGAEITEINGSTVKSASDAESTLRTGMNSIKTIFKKAETTLAVRIPLGTR
jgi:S1-C subfamily serine protease